MSRQRASDGQQKRAAHFVPDEQRRSDGLKPEDLCQRAGCNQLAISDWGTCSGHSFSRKRTGYRGQVRKKR